MRATFSAVALSFIPNIEVIFFNSAREHFWKYWLVYCQKQHNGRVISSCMWLWSYGGWLRDHDNVYYHAIMICNCGDLTLVICSLVVAVMWVCLWSRGYHMWSCSCGLGHVILVTSTWSCDVGYVVAVIWFWHVIVVTWLWLCDLGHVIMVMWF